MMRSSRRQYALDLCDGSALDPHEGWSGEPGPGEIGRGDPLPPGPYAIGLTHSPRGDVWPYTVICGDGRAIARHVNSEACAQGIVDALNGTAAVKDVVR